MDQKRDLSSRPHNYAQLCFDKDAEGIGRARFCTLLLWCVHHWSALERRRQRCQVDLPGQEPGLEH